MATIKKLWSSSAEIDSSQLCDHSTEYYSSDVDLETNGYEGAHVELVISWPSGAVEDLIVSAYPSLDSTYDGQERAEQSVIAFPVAGDSTYVSLAIQGWPHFRVGYLTYIVTTDDPTITSVNWRGWYWSVEA